MHIHTAWELPFSIIFVLTWLHFRCFSVVGEFVFFFFLVMLLWVQFMFVRIVTDGIWAIPLIFTGWSIDMFSIIPQMSVGHLITLKLGRQYGYPCNWHLCKNTYNWWKFIYFSKCSFFLRLNFKQADENIELTNLSQDILQHLFYQCRNLVEKEARSTYSSSSVVIFVLETW